MIPEDAQDIRLRVTEIFHSIQGEGAASGRPSAFVRLTGCPLRCGYCDTAYAFTEGEWMNLEEILQAVAAQPMQEVCVTGGEPLAQPACARLLSALCDEGYRVTLETSGALSVAGVDTRVLKALDIKTPGSGEEARNDWSNLEHLQPEDLVKFVICSREDYEWARDRVRERRWDCEVFFSPSWEQQDAGQLGEWIVADALPVRLQVQLHKVLWGDVRGR